MTDALRGRTMPDDTLVLDYTATERRRLLPYKWELIALLWLAANPR